MAAVKEFSWVLGLVTRKHEVTAKAGAGFDFEKMSDEELRRASWMLRPVVEAWPELAEAVRAGILALVEASRKG
jgi:hypothetical protein